MTGDGLLEIGRITKTHGLRGEVVVSLVTNVDDRLAPGVVVRADDRDVVVAEARPHQGRWLVRFEGVADRAEAEGYRGRTLYAEPLDDADELWLHELIGAEVVDADDVARGSVTEIQANPAADLLVLDSGAFVPVNFVVSFTDGRVLVDVPDGLWDL